MVLRGFFGRGWCGREDRSTLRFIRYANGGVVFEGSTAVGGLITNSDILRQQLLGFQ